MAGQYPDDLLDQHVVVKYKCSDTRIEKHLSDHLVQDRIYHDLHFGFYDGASSITREGYKKLWLADYTGNQIDHDLSNYAHFIANLTSVDGAVLLTDSLALRGFGAELVKLPEMTSVLLARDLDGTDIVGKVDMESFGTRHRSAFRWCALNPASIVFVVSQDGGIRVARKVDDHLLMWDLGAA